ncbi:alpha/beta hydrolase family protein [Roseibium algae]|uniref:Dienelactone hydrolase n=1 Tax=Roseibium algae TaxID=3123038 RepID=A0ABU8TEH7_9HYPH
MRFLIIIILMLSGTAQAQEYNVGIRRITTNVAGVEVSVRVFYPTQETATETKFGPWQLLAAKNSKLSSGQFPLVAISHGFGGNDWNHYLLASRLARSGYIVAAVRHPDDFLRIGQPEITVLRPSELSAAIDAVLKDNRFGSSIDAERIGAFGFSLGGFTVLAASGGNIDYAKITPHCYRPENDPEFCIGEDGGEPLPMWLRARRMLYSMPNVNLTQDVFDSRIKAVVAAAPVGLLFDDMSRTQVPVMLIRAGADQSLRFPYHAENVHKLLPNEHIYHVVEGLHHYAFLSPFPNGIAGEVGEPAKDPDGFDRAKFLAETNQTIVNFFKKTLIRK